MSRIVPIKSKGAMLALAIFFGHWAWLYTYRYDAWKFWLCTILNLVLFWTIVVPLTTWVLAILNAAMYDEEVLETYYEKA